MPAAARRGDPGIIHCSGYNIASGSPDVYINDRPAARVGDPSTTHLRPGPGRRCAPHVSKIVAGSPDVYVNGVALARQGDPLGMCTRIAQGSPNVVANG
jgi:uncharacterized Zn-binding protein involved in type VI secretion